MAGDRAARPIIRARIEGDCFTIGSFDGGRELGDGAGKHAVIVAKNRHPAAVHMRQRELPVGGHADAPAGVDVPDTRIIEVSYKVTGSVSAAVIRNNNLQVFILLRQYRLNAIAQHRKALARGNNDRDPGSSHEPLSPAADCGKVLARSPRTVDKSWSSAMLRTRPALIRAAMNTIAAQIVSTAAKAKKSRRRGTKSAHPEAARMAATVGASTSARHHRAASPRR